MLITERRCDERLLERQHGARLGNHGLFRLLLVPQVEVQREVVPHLPLRHRWTFRHNGHRCPSTIRPPPAVIMARILHRRTPGPSPYL